jgi:anti-anti-sigma regulatory factor
MLRISTNRGPGEIKLTLEGRLAGPWVDELARAWTSLTATEDARSLRIDLDAVSFIDSAGKALLGTMHEAGTTLVGSGCMTRAILDEIGTRPCTARRGAGAATRALYTSQDPLAQSQRDVALNLVALYKAVGGGWEVAGG